MASKSELKARRTSVSTASSSDGCQEDISKKGQRPKISKQTVPAKVPSAKRRAMGKGARSKLSTKLVEPRTFDIEKKVFASMEKKRKADIRKAEKEKSGTTEPAKATKKSKKAEQKEDPKPDVKNAATKKQPKAAAKKPTMPEKEAKDPTASVKQGRIEKTKAAGKKSTPPSAWQMLGGLGAASSTKFEDKNKKTGVLFRPTKRAAQERKVLEKMQAALKKPEAGGLVFGNMSEGKNKQEENPFEIMKLPEEVRNRLWKLAVVHLPFCIWPNQDRGREQPDLAMSGRETRDEVLRVYYGSNVFGIDITPVPEAEDKRDKIPKQGSGKAATKKTSSSAKVDSIAEIKQWAEVMEEGGNLSQIRHWVFSFTPEVEVEGRFPEIDDSKSLIIYLNIWREDGCWTANVEVHREACCVLPGHEAYQKCVIHNTPAWLNGMVGTVVQRAGRKGFTAEMLVGVATVLSKRAEDLVSARCQGAGIPIQGAKSRDVINADATEA